MCAKRIACEICGARYFPALCDGIGRHDALKSLNAPYGAHLGGLFENVACNSTSAPLRLEAAPLRCRGFRRSLKFELRELHAKFSDARCFLTRTKCHMQSTTGTRLNAPYGAWCFLTGH